MTDQHLRMNGMADATGGKAFFNTNGLALAAARITSSGADFYTLTYSPSQYREDKKWHKVRVTLDLPGCTLSYRRGYFADGLNNTPQEAPHALSRLQAGGRSEPAASSGSKAPLVFEARILPASDPDAHPAPVVLGKQEKGAHGNIPYSVHYTVPAQDLSLSLGQRKELLQHHRRGLRLQ